MDRDELEAFGAALAERHARAAEPEPEPENTLAHYAERSRAGDWSMRSALMRFAQPEAVRAGAVLELVRRLDAVLQHVVKPLQAHTVVCDRALVVGAAGSPVEPYPDTRTADLARVERADPDGFAAVRAGYVGVAGALDAEEEAALPLLGVALLFDDLAEELTRWAARGPQDPPTGAVDETCALVRARLDELGVPVEERPPGRGRRGV